MLLAVPEAPPASTSQWSEESKESQVDGVDGMESLYVLKTSVTPIPSVYRELSYTDLSILEENNEEVVTIMAKMGVPGASLVDLKKDRSGTDGTKVDMSELKLNNAEISKLIRAKWDQRVLEIRNKRPELYLTARPSESPLTMKEFISHQAGSSMG